MDNAWTLSLAADEAMLLLTGSKAAGEGVNAHGIQVSEQGATNISSYFSLTLAEYGDERLIPEGE